MKTIEKLIENAMADVELLAKNNLHGDVFTVPRMVDFLLIATNKEKADLVCGFINDYAYGAASTNSESGDHRILVQINMPITQHVLHAVSGFMQCIAELYGLEYDGWGCTLQNT
jgi:hypothetical protein